MCRLVPHFSVSVSQGFRHLHPVCVYDMKKECHRTARSLIFVSKMPKTPTLFPFLQQNAIADLMPSKFFVTPTLC